MIFQPRALLGSFAVLLCSSTAFAIRPVQVLDLKTEIGLAIPDQDEFLVRGTFPVPRGTLLPGGDPPVDLLDSDGTLIPDTQVEIVSRYPDSKDGADVLEVLARVHRDPSWAPGSFHSFQVVASKTGTKPDPSWPEISDLFGALIDPDPAVHSLLSDPLSMVVVARDPIGNLYYCFPLIPTGGGKVLRYGTYQNTFRTYSPMVKFGVPGATEYPHLFGVHAYFSTLSEEEGFLLDLRIHNGFDGNDPGTPLDDPLGKVYFERIDLLVRADGNDWTPVQQLQDPYAFDAQAGDTPGLVQAGPFAWSVFPLVEKLAKKGATQPMHMMPCRGQFVRRMAIAPADAIDGAKALVEQEGQAFCLGGEGQDLEWSWWNPATARYFPQAHILPLLKDPSTGFDQIATVRAKLDQWHDGLVAAVVNDQPFPYTPATTGLGSSEYALGWARPLGEAYGGSAGGQEIYFLNGVRTAATCSNKGYRMLQAVHQLRTSRQTNATYHKDGQQTFHDAWLNAQGNMVIDVNHESGSDSKVFCPPGIPLWLQNAVVANLGMEPYYETDDCPATGECISKLTEWGPYDQDHMPRYASYAMALGFLGNDQLAIDDLRMQAEIGRLDYTEALTIDGHNAHPASLALDNAYVTEFPNWGYEINRIEGWILHFNAGAFRFGDYEYRERNRAWFSTVLDVMQRGIGTVYDACFDQAAPALDRTAGILYATGIEQKTVCLDVRSRQAFMESIVQDGIRAMRESALKSPQDLASAESLLLRSIYGVCLPYAWDSSVCKPLNALAVSPAMPPLAKLYDYDPSDGAQCGIQPMPACGLIPYNSLDYNDLYFWVSMADGYRINGDRIFLERALQYLEGTCEPVDTLPLEALRTRLRDELRTDQSPSSETGTVFWLNRAALLGLVD